MVKSGETIAASWARRAPVETWPTWLGLTRPIVSSRCSRRQMEVRQRTQRPQ
jgi:hypothetical protein